MTTTVSGLRLRKVFGREGWLVPEPYGPDGWRMVARDRSASVIATTASEDGQEWIHASIGRVDEMPTYDDLVQLHDAVFAGRWAYQVFAPPQHHVNIHHYALHLWGRADGKPVLPNFGAMGTI